MTDGKAFWRWSEVGLWGLSTGVFALLSGVFSSLITTWSGRRLFLVIACGVESVQSTRGSSSYPKCAVVSGVARHAGCPCY